MALDRRPAANVGGLDQVVTILSELAERIDPQKLLAAALTAPLPWAQRLGYLLERVGAAEKTVALRSHVKNAAREMPQCDEFHVLQPFTSLSCELAHES